MRICVDGSLALEMSAYVSVSINTHLQGKKRQDIFGGLRAEKLVTVATGLQVLTDVLTCTSYNIHHIWQLCYKILNAKYLYSNRVGTKSTAKCVPNVFVYTTYSAVLASLY